MKKAIQTRSIKNSNGIFSTFDIVGSINNLVILEHPTLYIPAGPYVVKRDRTGKHQHWRIQDVEDRTFIEIHVGNTKADIVGCLAPGLAYQGDAVIYSNAALQIMHDWFEDADWLLEIKEDYVGFTTKALTVKS